MEWVVDQIDEGWVSVEVDGTHVERVPVWMFPGPVREGDVYRVTRESGDDRVTMTVVRDSGERDRRIDASRQQVAHKPQQGGSGDIVL
jgi:hypothetical protein